MSARRSNALTEPLLRRRAGCLCARLEGNRLCHALWRVSSATGQHRSCSAPVLAFGPDVHRRELHRQGGGAAGCRRAWLGDRGARHEPARARHSGRERQLRLWIGRRVLRRCVRAAVVTRLSHVLVHHEGAAREDRIAFPVDPNREPASSDIRWAATARSPSRSSIPTATSRCRPSRRSLRRSAARGAKRPWPDISARIAPAGAKTMRRRSIEERGWAGSPILVDQGTKIHFWKPSSSPNSCAKRVGAPASRSICACETATTIVTSSSRLSLRTICDFTLAPRLDFGSRVRSVVVLGLG